MKPEYMTHLSGSEEELHALSHDARGSLGMDTPDYTMGPLAARLNTLRTRIREGELLAVRTFWRDCAEGPSGFPDSRDDIIRVMNRLSSALYWLFCRSISKGR
jgi:ethanolamine utilization cobalamin adenosyltransferase